MRSSTTRRGLILVALLLGGGCTSSPPCAKGLTECGDRCVDLRADPGNCGGCGAACPQGKVCGRAACLAACPVGEVSCGGGCFNLNLAQRHCGKCAIACRDSDQTCFSGLCRDIDPKSGSCPFVYLEDSGRYRYYTDLSGSTLGAGLSFFRPAYYGVNIYELGDWAAQGDTLRMRLRELLYEASYVDHTLLVFADVPAGHGVYNEWSSTPQLDRAPSLRYVTVRDPRPPAAARTADGVDVLRQVSAADGIPVPVTATGLSRVEVDFGPVAHPERARLIITTWGVYADLRIAQSPPYSAGTVIETPDGAGGWRERVVAGKSASDSRSWAIDLAGVLAADSSRMRITLAHQPSTLDVLDAVLLDDSEQVAIQLRAAAPRVAELRFGGAAHVEPATPTSRTRALDEQRPVDPAARLRGSYTRYGDVRPLLAAPDDRFAIMGQGDELYLEFDAPPQPPGVTRRLFLQAEVYYTLKFHPFGQLTETIDPLPYHGMTTYPYPAEVWPYRADASYAEYLHTWNTRGVSLP